MKRKALFITFLISISFSIFSAKVDTIKVYSEAMKKEIYVIVVTPDNYSAKYKYPVAYLLHGYGGNHVESWAAKEFDIIHLADEYNMIYVIPDGGNSWYFDSPVDPAFRYETFVAKELVSYIDKNYSTKNSSYGRCITGFSMGGHGALYLAFRNQDVFGAAGSTSGAVDIRPFASGYEIANRLGSYAEYPENWEKNTVVNMIHLLVPNSLALIIDCGTEDFLYEENCLLHEKLLYYNIPQDFILRPGAHTVPYWKNAIRYQLMFFHQFFEENKSK